jgi:hypothetical protein
MWKIVPRNGTLITWRKEYNHYLPDVSNEEKIAKNSNQSYGVTNPHSFDCPVM